MSDSTHYKLAMTGSGFDPEFALFRLFRDVPEAKNYFDAHGKPSGNGYDWRSLEEDMREFSKTMPEVTFLFTEYGTYDNDAFEFRHYFRAGQYARVEPVVVTTWPEFSDDLLE
jgi:hypothetical protein